MATQKVSIRYLIDVAIGNPEPGIVNFNALYTVLQAISERLAMQDDNIEIDSSYCPVATNVLESKSNVSSEKLVEHHVFDYPSGQMPDLSIDKAPIKKSLQTPVLDDRKVAFDAGAEVDDTSIQSGKKKDSERLTTYRSELKQHIDALNARLEKIENYFVASAEAEQRVTCLVDKVTDVQNRLEKTEEAIEEFRDMRTAEERDISACRKRMEQDEFTATIEEMKREICDLKRVARQARISGSFGFTPRDSNVIDSDIFDKLSRHNDELVELKIQVCQLNGQVMTLIESSNEPIDMSMVVTVEAFEEGMLGFRTEIDKTLAQFANVQREVDIQKQVVDELNEKLVELAKIKIDKEEIDELLSEKADYTMLQRKVSVENMETDLRKIENQINEIADCFVLNDDRVQKQIADIKRFLGDQTLDELLFDFKAKVDKEIQIVRDAVKKLADMKTDVDSSAARLRDLTCLACDQDVVMKAVELTNLAQFGDAYVTNSISPEVAFEVGKIRQIIKEDATGVNNTLCDVARKFRHSGGMHTVITKKDMVDKVKRT